MSNYWIELAITNDRQDLADRVTNLGKEIQAILSPEQPKQPEREQPKKSVMVECWEAWKVKYYSTAVWIEFKRDDRRFMRTFGDDAIACSKVLGVPFKPDDNPPSLTMHIRVEEEKVKTIKFLKEKGISTIVLPFAMPPKSEPETPKDWCDRINELDDSELAKLFKETFGAQVSDLVGLRVEWKAFVHLADTEFDSLIDCWNDFAESDRAMDWAASNEEQLQTDEDDEF